MSIKANKYGATYETRKTRKYARRIVASCRRSGGPNALADLKSMIQTLRRMCGGSRLY